MDIEIYLECLLSILLGRSGIPAAHNNSIFNLLKNNHTVFHSGMSLYIPITMDKDSDPYQHFLLMIAILMSVS